jgi:asparagine synthase (glutamine-hydrolysing)
MELGRLGIDSINLERRRNKMSGIAGILYPGEGPEVQQILMKLSHRGDTPPRFWDNHAGQLGALGYSQIGEKPGPYMTSGSRAIVFDGRLVNRSLLIRELGLEIDETKSDAEVVLMAYEERGTRMMGKLDGEFALAIIDDGRLVLARDRLGIRPLYYGFRNEKLFFASEIKALVECSDMVHEFPPGNFLASDRGLYPYQTYFPDSIRLEGAQESAQNLVHHLEEATRRSLPEEVPVGVWLSGGVDSSVVAALARPLVDRLYTFSAGVEGAPDLEYARLVAEHIGAEHYERIYGLEEMKAVMENVIYHLESFDAPLVRSAISNYLVSELASDHVPFVYSGEGGDELFAGYAYQKACRGEIELTLSIQDAIASLHNTALQRVDRSATAHCSGVAAPFLDPDVVRYALAIPARWMIRGEQPVDKWPLRQGLASTLPEEVIWRGKSKFWQGSGTGEMLNEFAENVVSDQEFANNADLENGDRLRTKEELIYYRIFHEHFGDKHPYTEMGRTQHI